MKTILLISPFQYGYHTDMDKYGEYLSDQYRVDYLCVNGGQQKIKAPGNINVIYINRLISNKITRLYFIIRCITHIIVMKPDYVIVTYFLGCSLLAEAFRKKRMIVDIRTGNVDPDAVIRGKKNRKITFEAKKFKYILVVSQGLGELLHLNGENTCLLPLGAERVSERDGLDTKNMDLLYIGTFNHRNIEETVKGFALFYSKYKDRIQCRYTIIGYSDDPAFKQRITREIDSGGLKGIVNCIGRVPNTLLKPYFESHNIGVAFVPINEQYDHQPPTKTFEYLHNGLVCIATKLKENSRIITPQNGVLIEDNSRSFFEGLESIYHNLDQYEQKVIMESVNEYSWRRIVNDNLKKILERI